MPLRRLGAVQGNKPSAGTQINWRHPLTRGLVASFLFNEGHGRMVHDGAQGRDLVWQNTSTDPAWVGSVLDLKSQTTADALTYRHLGSAVRFPGAPTDFFTNPESYLYPQLAGHVSVEVWIWFDTDTVSFPTPISLGAVNSDGFQLPLKSGGSGIWRVGADGTQATDTGAFPTPPQQRWQHFVGTFDAGAAPVGGTTGQLAIYRDGILRNLGSVATGPAATVALRLGNSSGGGNAFAGYMALVRLWDRALSPDEVQELYQDPLGMYGIPKSVVSVPGILATRDARLPLEFLGLSTLFRDARLPLEFLGLSTLFRDAQLPVSISGALTRDPRLPVDWIGTVAPPRDARAPLAFTGIDPNLLLHRWLVLVKLNAPLLHAWSVHTLARTYSLSHQWEVKEPLPALPHRWNVTGDILTPFGVSPATGEPLPTVGTGPAPGDVQQPVATKDKTP